MGRFPVLSRARVFSREAEFIKGSGLQVGPAEYIGEHRPKGELENKERQQI